VNRKFYNPNFDQTLEILRSQSFVASPSSEVAGGILVAKYGAGAVLRESGDLSAPVCIVVHPGALIAGKVAQLLDRGYQKFIKTSQFELPATASQLHAIHMFTEELKALTRTVDLYNESLGTTSDLYLYDRLQGREAEPPAAQRPWELAGGH
jgi:hypothetical protein